MEVLSRDNPVADENKSATKDNDESRRSETLDPNIFGLLPMLLVARCLSFTVETSFDLARLRLVNKAFARGMVAAVIFEVGKSANDGTREEKKASAVNVGDSGGGGGGGGGGHRLICPPKCIDKKKCFVKNFVGYFGEDGTRHYDQVIFDEDRFDSLLNHFKDKVGTSAYFLFDRPTNHGLGRPLGNSGADDEHADYDDGSVGGLECKLLQLTLLERPTLLSHFCHDAYRSKNPPAVATEPKSTFPMILEPDGKKSNKNESKVRPINHRHHRLPALRHIMEFLQTSKISVFEDVEAIQRDIFVGGLYEPIGTIDGESRGAEDTSNPSSYEISRPTVLDISKFSTLEKTKKEEESRMEKDKDGEDDSDTNDFGQNQIYVFGCCLTMELSPNDVERLRKMNRSSKTSATTGVDKVGKNEGGDETEFLQIPATSFSEIDLKDLRWGPKQDQKQQPPFVVAADNSEEQTNESTKEKFTCLPLQLDCDYYAMVCEDDKTSSAPVFSFGLSGESSSGNESGKDDVVRVQMLCRMVACKQMISDLGWDLDRPKKTLTASPAHYSPYYRSNSEWRQYIQSNRHDEPCFNYAYLIGSTLTSFLFNFPTNHGFSTDCALKGLKILSDPKPLAVYQFQSGQGKEGSISRQDKIEEPLPGTRDEIMVAIKEALAKLSVVEENDILRNMEQEMESNGLFEPIASASAEGIDTVQLTPNSPLLQTNRWRKTRPRVGEVHCLSCRLTFRLKEKSLMLKERIVLDDGTEFLSIPTQNVESLLSERFQKLAQNDSPQKNTSVLEEYEFLPYTLGATGESGCCYYGMVKKAPSSTTTKIEGATDTNSWFGQGSLFGGNAAASASPWSSSPLFSPTNNTEVEVLCRIVAKCNKLQRHSWDVLEKKLPAEQVRTKFQDQTVVEGVFVADHVIPTDLVAALSANIDRFASWQIEEKDNKRGGLGADYHPYSNDVVRDIVHPGLYSYVKDISPLRADKDDVPPCIFPTPPPPLPVASNTDRFWFQQNQDDNSERVRDFWGRAYENSIYQWLPTYFEIAPNGECTIHDYINNLVPRSDPAVAPLYDNLARLFEKCVPMMESVYAYVCGVRPLLRQENAHLITYCEDDSCLKSIDQNSVRYPFRGQKLQVVTKIVDYELSPGQSHEGVWHVEGMSHEEIVLTCLYVLDRDDELTGGEIRFKRAFLSDEADFIYSHADQERAQDFNDIVKDGLAPLGVAETNKGRVIVFPNSHIHKVEPMTCALFSAGRGSDGNTTMNDHNAATSGTTASGGNFAADNDETKQEKVEKTKRRIVVFFLVNPLKRIVSTREVAPQQQQCQESHNVGDAKEKKTNFTMTVEEALEHRLLLMKDRKFTKQDWNVREIELCEH